jgi:hypothetical protein
MSLKRDQKSSLFFLFFAGVMLVSSVQASLGSFSSPGSGLLAFLAALLLAFFSLVSFFLPYLRKGETRERPVFSSSEIHWGNLLATLIALFAFPVVLKPLGFTVTLFGFTLFMSKAIGARSWTGAILFSLITTFASYLFFVSWLKFFTEKGMLGIY